MSSQAQARSTVQTVHNSEESDNVTVVPQQQQKEEEFKTPIFGPERRYQRHAHGDSPSPHNVTIALNEMEVRLLDLEPLAITRISRIAVADTKTGALDAWSDNKPVYDGYISQSLGEFKAELICLSGETDQRILERQGAVLGRDWDLVKNVFSSGIKFAAQRDHTEEIFVKKTWLLSISLPEGLARARGRMGQHQIKLLIGYQDLIVLSPKSSLVMIAAHREDKRLGPGDAAFRSVKRECWILQEGCPADKVIKSCMHCRTLTTKAAQWRAASVRSLMVSHLPGLMSLIVEEDIKGQLELEATRDNLAPSPQHEANFLQNFSGPKSPHQHSCPVLSQWRDGRSEVAVKKLNRSMRDLNPGNDLTYADHCLITPNLLLQGSRTRAAQAHSEDGNTYMSRLMLRLGYIEQCNQDWWNLWLTSVWLSLVAFRQWKVEHCNVTVGDVLKVSHQGKVAKPTFRLARALKALPDKEGNVRSVVVGYRPRHAANQRKMKYVAKLLEELTVSVQRLVVILAVKEQYLLPLPSPHKLSCPRILNIPASAEETAEDDEMSSPPTAHSVPQRPKPEDSQEASRGKTDHGALYSSP